MLPKPPKNTNIVPESNFTAGNERRQQTGPAPRHYGCEPPNYYLHHYQPGWLPPLPDAAGAAGGGLGWGRSPPAPEDTTTGPGNHASSGSTPLMTFPNSPKFALTVDYDSANYVSQVNLQSLGSHWGSSVSVLHSLARASSHSKFQEAGTTNQRGSHSGRNVVDSQQNTRRSPLNKLDRRCFSLVSLPPKSVWLHVTLAGNGIRYLIAK